MYKKTTPPRQVPAVQPDPPVKREVPEPWGQTETPELAVVKVNKEIPAPKETKVQMEPMGLPEAPENPAE